MIRVNWITSISPEYNTAKCMMDLESMVAFATSCIFSIILDEEGESSTLNTYNAKN
jgi:hypothetical protein